MEREMLRMREVKAQRKAGVQVSNAESPKEIVGVSRVKAFGSRGAFRING